MSRIPKTLKNFNLYVDGRGYAGVVNEVELPELSIKTEEHRAGGMDVPIELDMGMEMLSCKLTMAEYEIEQMRLFGLNGLESIPVTLRGALQEEGDPVQAVIVNLRGRFKKVELGTWKPGDKTEPKYEVSCTYFKFTQDGQVLTEIDALNMKRIIGGVDQLAAIRTAIGV